MIDDRDLERHLQAGDDALWNPADPPPLDLAAITGVAPTARVASPGSLTAHADGPTPARRRRLLSGRPVAARPLALAGGALACLIVGTVIGSQVIAGGASPNAPVAKAPKPVAVPVQRVDLRPLDGAPARALAVASVFSSGTGKRIDLRITGLPPLRHGTFYEVWALGKAGRMVSLGTVSVDDAGDGQTSMRLPVSLRRFPVLDISLERADGNPAHSGHSLLRAPV